MSPFGFRIETIRTGEIPLANVLSELQQTLAMRFARCLYGEIERGSTQPSFTTQNHFVGVSFTHQSEHDALSAGIHDWLHQLLEGTKRCKHKLIDVKVTLIGDQLIIIGYLTRVQSGF